MPENREREYDQIPSECGQQCIALERLRGDINVRLTNIESNAAIALAGVANFRNFQTNVSEFIIRQDESAKGLASHLKDKEEAEDRRRSRNWKIIGIAATAIFGVCAFIAPKIWNQVATLQRLEDDWTHYYNTPPTGSPVPYRPNVPVPQYKPYSYFEQHNGISQTQELRPLDISDAVRKKIDSYIIKNEVGEESLGIALEDTMPAWAWNNKERKMK